MEFDKFYISPKGFYIAGFGGINPAAITGYTNSIAENLNSQIQVIKTVGRGFANPNSYRNAILFFQGKLNLFPC